MAQTTQNPLNSYQYIFLHSADANSPDTIWLKGDNECPTLTSAASTFTQSEEYTSRLSSTKDFYAGFWDLLEDVYDYMSENLTYAKVYDIFDLLNVANLHNSSVPQNLTDEELFQLRTLADSAEFAGNFNASQPERSVGGQTLAGAILHQLNQTVASEGKKPKFSLLASSYDSFLTFFGICELDSCE